MCFINKLKNHINAGQKSPNTCKITHIGKRGCITLECKMKPTYYMVTYKYKIL